MKVYQLKELNESDLRAKLKDSLDAIQNLKFQKALQQLEDASSISGQIFNMDAGIVTFKN